MKRIETRFNNKLDLKQEGQAFELLKATVEVEKKIKINVHPDYLIAVSYLVNKYPEEVAWYSTVSTEIVDGILNYTINGNIIIPEQLTQGAFVETKESENEKGEIISVGALEKALREDYPDENTRDIINNSLRIHGHSHVNMTVERSGVDISHQNGLIKNLPFFIAHIANKQGNHNLYILDNDIQIKGEQFTQFPTVELVSTEFKTDFSAVSLMMDTPGLLNYIDECLKNRVKKAPKKSYPVGYQKSIPGLHGGYKHNKDHQSAYSSPFYRDMDDFDF